jgi:hypothetical protein
VKPVLSTLVKEASKAAIDEQAGNKAATAKAN